MRSLFLFLFAVLLLLSGCSNPEIVEEPQPEQPEPHTLLIKVLMPDEGGTKSTTRLALSETEVGSISVKWKAGDKINLCFVSGDGTTIKTVNDVAATNISSDGKSADFSLAIPEGISGTFNLYGVYGASFSPADSKTVIFSAPAGSTAGTTLPDIEPVSVMRFEAEAITGTSTLQVNFDHIGSIFSVWIYNDTASPVVVGKITLSSAGKGYNWLRNSSGQATFDIADNSFINANAGTELVYSPPAGSTIAAGASLKLYRWVVPGNEIDPSDTSQLMDIKDINGSTFTETIFARALQTGKYYRLKMVYDGSRFRYIKIPTDSGLVGYWPFDGNAEDVAGENDGSLFGNVTLTTDRDGNADAAYQFNGSSGDYIKCISPGITGTGARTFSFWAKADAWSTSEQTILSYGGSTTAYGGRFEMSLANGEMICDISWSNLGKKSAAITAAVWNFYTVVFIGGANQTLSTGVRYYVNGTLITDVGRKTRDDVINTLSNNPIYFGSLFGTGRYFKGAIDEVRMYDRALIGSEVKGLYYKDRSF
ncbi:MAG: LamG domain-containing protein [Proteiniphilum sp.]|nr:LamG domain-containing protein [Proteiniphilum sp.]